MATAIRRRKKRLILDIGSSSIRMCEMVKVKNGYQLTKYQQRDFNTDPALSDDERKENRVRVLQALLKEAKIRTRKTIFGVPGQSVFTRTRPLPPVPEYKVSQIVRYEIQQQIPFSLDQIAMDYQILDRTSAGGYEVMMAAIKVDVVDKHVEILTGAKCVVDIVDVSPLAGYNWLKKTGAFGTGTDCVAMIDLGASTTDIVIEREGQFRFTRPVNVGGTDITKAISAAFGLNFSDAERAKRERGFAPTGDPAKDGKAGEVIGQVLQRMVSEIMRSFAFFRSQPGGGQVNRVVLCGGGARMRNIAPFLQNSLGLEVKIAEPLSGIQVAEAAKSVYDSPEQASVVLGLALRCCEPVPIEINLIPPRVLENMRIKEQAFYWTLILSTLGLIFASVIPVKAKQNELDQARISVLRSHIEQYDPEISRHTGTGPPPPSSKVNAFRGIEIQVMGYHSHILTLDTARSNRKFWLDEMALISEARPAGGKIVITAFESAVVEDAALPPVPVAEEAPAPGDGEGYDGGYDEYGYGYDEDYGDYGGGYGGGFGGVMGNTQENAAGAIVRGFPGVDGLFSAGGMGGMPGMGGGMGGFGGGYGEDYGEEDYGGGGYGGGYGGGMPGMMSGVSRYNARLSTDMLPDVTVETPNGVNINGLAESDILIQQFVNNLETAQRTLYNRDVLRVTRVYFAEATVSKVGQNALYNAKAAIGRTGGGMRRYRGDSWFSFQINIVFETLSQTELATAQAANIEGIPAQ